MAATSRAGFEPTTSGSGGQRSIQLGYRDSLYRQKQVYPDWKERQVEQRGMTAPELQDTLFDIQQFV